METLQKISMRSMEWNGGWFCSRCEKLKSARNAGYKVIDGFHIYCADCANELVKNGNAKILDKRKQK